MFKILDRYLLRQFFQTYIFTVFLLVMIVSVIDYSEKSDDFLNIPFKTIFFSYYLNFFLFVANLVTPIIVFIATVFVTARLAGRTEIIAMLSGGMSFGRIMRPYFIGAFLIALGSFLLNGWVTPRANRIKAQFEMAYIKNPFRFEERNFHVKIDSTTYIYLQNYNNALRTGYKFTMERISDSLDLKEKLSTDLIRWDTTKNTWHIDRYRIHHFDGQEERLEEGFDLDTLIAMRPEDFESKHLLHESLTLPELDTYIADQLKRGNSNLGVFWVEKYQRYASPFAIIILSMMGVVVASRKSRQGTSFQIALGFVLSFIFLLLAIIGRSIGQSGSLNPYLAVWIPNVIFALVAVWLYRKVPK
ncbi:MAG: LptF/LptG family permease [Bernardetiaceae bacterium]